MSVQKKPQSDLKHRVITCLNKLSDRDTLTVAINELESITKTLTHDSFSPFLTCLSTTDASQKSPVRKQCVRLLGLLSIQHRDSLSPHLTKMLSSVIQRLREPDSSVRSACVDAVSSMASNITKPPFSSFMKPLVDSLLLEQDYNAQMGSALCLAAAIDSSPDPEPAQLQKLLPRFSKLVRNDSFKAKPALLSVIGSISGAGGASNRNVLNYLIPCLIEFLSSNDWSARKAAAETLIRLTLFDKNRLTEFKSQCIASLENKRFDKVKLVRETMNQAIEAWKEVPGDLEDGLLPHPQSNSSTKDVSNSKSSPSASRSSQNNHSSESPQPRKLSSNARSSPSVNLSSSDKKSPLKNGLNKPSSAGPYKADPRRPSNWTIEIAEPKPWNSRATHEEIVSDRSFAAPTVDNSTDLKPESRRVLFKEYSEEKSNSSRFGSRVVPFHEIDDRQLTQLDFTENNASEDAYMNQKEVENLSLIQKQLLQIENQQSSLLDLLQRYIGSSQSGISNLETRVNGLEKALDEISYDLAVSTGRINPSNEYNSNSCCMLPGTEFLSPKYWRRNEGHFSASKFSFPGRNQPQHSASTNSGNGERMFSPRAQNHNGVTRRDSRASVETFPHRSPRKLFADADVPRTPNESSFGNRVHH